MATDVYLQVFYILVFFLMVVLIVFALVKLAWKFYGNKKKSTNECYTATKELYNLCCSENSRVWWNKGAINKAIVHKYDDVKDFELVIDGSKYTNKAEMSKALIDGNVLRIRSLYINVYLKNGGIEKLIFLEPNFKVDAHVYEIALDKVYQAINMLSAMAKN